jgi:hypothetical protein
MFRKRRWWRGEKERRGGAACFDIDPAAESCYARSNFIGRATESMRRLIRKEYKR